MIRCGNCRALHKTVQEVKACYARRGQPTSSKVSKVKLPCHGKTVKGKACQNFKLVTKEEAITRAGKWWYCPSHVKKEVAS